MLRVIFFSGGELLKNKNPDGVCMMKRTCCLVVSSMMMGEM